VTSLSFGLVYDLLGCYPRQPGAPVDVDAECEPEETVEVLEEAVRRLGPRGFRVPRLRARRLSPRRGGSPALAREEPLCTFGPGGSFGSLAELEARPLADRLAEAIAGGLQRLGLGRV
jgi:hypothetical protein